MDRAFEKVPNADGVVHAIKKIRTGRLWATDELRRLPPHGCCRIAIACSRGEDESSPRSDRQPLGRHDGQGLWQVHQGPVPTLRRATVRTGCCDEGTGLLQDRDGISGWAPFSADPLTPNKVLPWLMPAGRSESRSNRRHGLGRNAKRARRTGQEWGRGSPGTRRTVTSSAVRALHRARDERSGSPPARPQSRR